MPSPPTRVPGPPSSYDRTKKRLTLDEIERIMLLQRPDA
jgi:hypothetical protein